MNIGVSLEQDPARDAIDEFYMTQMDLVTNAGAWASKPSLYTKQAFLTSVDTTSESFVDALDHIKLADLTVDTHITCLAELLHTAEDTRVSNFTRIFPKATFDDKQVTEKELTATLSNDYYTSGFSITDMHQAVQAQFTVKLNRDIDAVVTAMTGKVHVPKIRDLLAGYNKNSVNTSRAVGIGIALGALATLGATKIARSAKR